MANVGTAYVTIAPTMKGFSSSVSSMLNGQAGNLGKGASNSFSSKFQSSGTSKIGAVMGAVAGVASTVATSAFNAIGQSMGAAISRVDQLNNFPKVMQNLGYSSEDASRSIQKMSSAIDGLPTSLDSLSGLTQQLAPLCSNLDEATDISIALNNAMLAGGKSSEDVSRALTQYTQALSKGKPDLMDWRTLQEVMPGQLDQIAQAMLGAGKNSNDLYEELKNGTVSMTDFNNAVLKLNSEGIDGFASFEQQARDATQGIGTALSNVQNRLAKAGETLINAFGATRISGAINAVTSSFGKIANTIAPAFTFLGNASEKAVKAIGSLASTVSSKLTPVFDAAKDKIQPVADAISQSFEPLKSRVSGIVTSCGVAFNGFFNQVKTGSLNLQSVTSTFDVIKTSLTNIFDDTPVQQYVDKVKAKFSELASGGLIAGLSEKLSTIGEINFAGINITPILENVISKVQTINSFLMSTGTQIVNFFKTVGEGIANAFSGFDVSNLQVLFNLGTLVTPMGLLTTALSQIGDVLSNTIGSVLQSLAPVVVSIVQTALNLVQSIMPTLVNLGSIVSSVLATGLNAIMTILQALTPVFTIICNLVAQIMPTLGTLAGTVLQSLMTVISLVASTLSQIASAVLPVVLSVIQMITPFIQQIATLIAQLVTSLAPLISQLVGTLVPVIQSILNAIQPLVQAVLNVVQAVFPVVQAGLTVAMSLISALIPVITNIISVVVSVVSSVISALTPVISVVTSIVTTVVNVIATIITTISPIISFIAGVVASVISAIGNVLNVVTGIIATVASVVSSIISLVSSFVSNVISFISGLVSSVVGFFTGLASSLFSTVSSMWDSVRNTFSNGVTNVIDCVRDLPNQIIGFFSNAGTWLIESGKSIIDGLVNGIKGAVSGAVDAVSGVVSSIRDLFPFSPAKKGPFSGHGWVLYSGMSIMNALADGVEKKAGSTIRTVKGVMEDVANVATFDAGMNLAYAGAGAINSGTLQVAGLSGLTSSRDNRTINVSLNYSASDNARTMFNDLVTRLETLDKVRG
jgi:tape measure domain-containing protein